MKKYFNFKQGMFDVEKENRDNVLIATNEILRDFESLENILINNQQYKVLKVRVHF